MNGPRYKIDSVFGGYDVFDTSGRQIHVEPSAIEGVERVIVDGEDVGTIYDGIIDGVKAIEMNDGTSGSIFEEGFFGETEVQYGGFDDIVIDY